MLPVSLAVWSTKDTPLAKKVYMECIHSQTSNVLNCILVGVILVAMNIIITTLY